MTTSETTRRRTPGLLTKLALLLIATLIALVAVEGAIRLLNLLAPARAAAAIDADSDNENQTPTDEAAEDAKASRWILHPYRGITPRPSVALGAPPDGDTVDLRPKSSVFGTRSQVADPRDLPEEDLIVAVFGGSVARGIGLTAHHQIAREIRKSLGPDGPAVQIINFAVSGYKQPQQLHLLEELFLLGVPIDVVINIDGFNEIALSATDANRGRHPYYPQYDFWISAFGSATGGLSEAQIEKTADIIRFRRQARATRGWLAKQSLLSHLELVRAMVGSMAAKAEHAAVIAEEELRELPLRTAADEIFQIDDDCFGKYWSCWDLIIDVFEHSSELMAATSQQFGARYVHALQPNQYVDGSKVLSAEEREQAWAPDRPWSQAAIRGYPLLREAGERLVAKGIDFHDMTGVFAGHTETLYRDPCCHPNHLGYRLLGTELGRIVGDLVTTN